jgi:hypothetical protein
MPSWQDIVSQTRSGDHLVQLYEDEPSLTSRVTYFVLEGLRRREGIIAIATRSHREAFGRLLEGEGIDVERAIADGQLIFLDAEETLSRFMVDGQPDSDRFELSVGSLVERAAARAMVNGWRAFGEMVDVLWKSGNRFAATRLEQLWHRLLQRRSVPLLCAYQIDILGSAFREEAFQWVLALHSHLLPVGDEGILESAVAQAMEEVIGPERVKALDPLMAATQHSRVSLGPAEASVVWLSRTLPEYCDRIFRSARLRFVARCGGSGAR